MLLNTGPLILPVTAALSHYMHHAHSRELVSQCTDTLPAQALPISTQDAMPLTFVMLALIRVWSGLPMKHAVLLTTCHIAKCVTECSLCFTCH